MRLLIFLLIFLTSMVFGDFVGLGSYSDKITFEEFRAEYLKQLQIEIDLLENCGKHFENIQPVNNELSEELLFNALTNHLNPFIVIGKVESSESTHNFLLKNWNHYQHLGGFEKNKEINNKHAREALKIALRRRTAPLAALHFTDIYQGDLKELGLTKISIWELKERRVFDENGVKGLASILKEVITFLDEPLFSPKLVDEMAQNLTNSNLMIEFFSALFSSKKTTQKVKKLESLNEALMYILNLPIELSEGMPQKGDTLKQFYHLALIDYKFEQKFFKNFELIPELFNKQNLGDFNEALTKFLQIEAHKENEIQKKLNLKNLKNIDDFQKTSKLAKDYVFNKIQDTLLEENIQISREEFFELEKKWGGLEPIFILMTRFKEKELKIRSIGEIFKASLEGKFKEYKYYGQSSVSGKDEKAAEQLAIIKKNPKPWIEDFASIDYVQDEGVEEVQKKSWQNLKEMAQAIIFEHGKIESEREGFELDILPLLDKGTHPKEKLAKIKGELKQENLSEESLIQINNKILSQTSKLDFYKENSTLINALSFYQWFHKEFSEELRVLMGENYDVVSSDLKVFKDNANKIIHMHNKKEDYVILTTFNSDPKHMLMIGEVVKGTGSCQSYITGSHIDTLPAYVMDANVKAMVSYEINSESFYEKKTFEKIKKQFREGKKATNIVFDGNKQIVSFRIDENVYQTLPFQTARLRKMVKIGTHKKWWQKSPSLFVEPGYTNFYNGLGAMRELQRKYLQEIAQSLGAKLSKETRVVGTRHEYGVYSDVSGGAQFNDYKAYINFK